MSWSLSDEIKVSEVSTLDILKSLKEKERDGIGNNQCPTERDHQVDGALAAAESFILESGIYLNADVLSVSLSGHANPGHKKAEGFANEFVSISIGAKSYK